MSRRFSLPLIRRAEHYFESSTVADLDRGSYTKGSPHIQIYCDSMENILLGKKGSETDL